MFTFAVGSPSKSVRPSKLIAALDVVEKSVQQSAELHDGVVAPANTADQSPSKLTMVKAEGKYLPISI